MTNKNYDEIFSSHVPLPMCIVDGKGKIVSASPRMCEVFLYDAITGTNVFALTGMSMDQLDKAAKEGLALKFRGTGKIFQVSVAFTGENDGSKALYFTDVTDLEEMRNKYNSEQNCMAWINIDNYDELVQETSENNQRSVLSEIDRCIRAWGQQMEASVARVRSQMYLVIMEKARYEQAERSHFSILDEVREIDTETDFPITLSIGIGIGEKTPSENDKAAEEALEMALARGGDQCVVKEGDKLSLYGGKTQSVEKGNKGKARIIGYALVARIKAARNVIIMGHSNPDMDAFGSALGIHRLAQLHNKNTYIIVNRYNEALKTMYEAVQKTGNYEIIKNEQALKISGKDTLLVVVDTHKPSLTECPELLDIAENVVVIDHHRLGEEYIKRPTLSYMESYASSAAELVTEILQYTIDRRSLEKIEAESLLAGILLDTNRFSVKTGVRTFEAAAWLRRVGADMSDVKSFFQNDRDTVIKRGEGIVAAEFSEDGFAFSMCKGENENAQIINSQIADELLLCRGVKASFVSGRDVKGHTVVSARSNGNFNVQTLMENFGGGGHMNTAGARMDVSPEQALEEIKKILERKEEW